IVPTEAGDAAMADQDAPSPSRSITQKPKRKKRAVEDEWFPIAANLIKDGLSDAAIARRVGVARSTLVYNKRWKNARKLFTPKDNRPRHFEKRRGIQQPLPTADNPAPDELNSELNDESEN